MKTVHQQRIEKFMGLAGQAVPAAPVMPSFEVRRLRANLILEEALETIAGLGFEVNQVGPDGDFEIKEFQHPDIVEVVDGCADISVVTVGTLSAFGVSDAPVLDVVDHANLRKFSPGSYRREFDGKWMKPPDFKPADIMSVLLEQGYDPHGSTKG